MLEIAKYRKLFKVYGTTWDGDGQTTFGVPDFRNRSIWGVSSTDTLGYIEGAIPNASGNIYSSTNKGGPFDSAYGICSTYDQVGTCYANGGGKLVFRGISISLSRSSSLYKSVSYVQPTSLAVRVKTKAK